MATLILFLAVIIVMVVGAIWNNKSNVLPPRSKPKGLWKHSSTGSAAKYNIDYNSWRFYIANELKLTQTKNQTI